MPIQSPRLTPRSAALARTSASFRDAATDLVIALHESRDQLASPATAEAAMAVVDQGMDRLLQWYEVMARTAGREPRYGPRKGVRLAPFLRDGENRRGNP